MKKSFREWCLENNSQKLLDEWLITENLPLTPDNVLYGSQKKIKWQCSDCGLIWEAKVYSRTEGSGCRNCKNKKRIKTVIKKNGSLFDSAPHLEKEWLTIKNDGILITEVTPSSNKKVWWKCSKCNYEWQASPATRLKGHGCPVCSGRNITKEKSLAIKNPELSSEWNYKRNGDLTPYDVGTYSERKVWWICRNGHEWKQTVSNRFQGRGCAKCSAELKSSFPEQAIFYYLNKYLNVDNRTKINNWEADIFLPDYNIAIEYDGIVYHSKDFIKERELRKNKAFEEKHIDLIRVKESQAKEGIENNIVYFKIDTKYTRFKCALLLLFELLEQKTGIAFNETFDIEKDRLEIINQYYKIEKKNNFAEKFPALIKYWNHERNLNLKPENFKAKSNEIVWWKCPICKGEWQESIINVSNGNRCPYCSGHRVLKGYNDLETLNPSLANEWNYKKNTLTPNDVTAGSNQKVWWICSKCGYEWRAIIAYRKQHSNCPKCSGSIKRNKENYYNNEKWLIMYEYAKQYYLKHNNLEIPATYICEDGTKLGSWIRTQRVSFKNNDLTEERLKLLNNINMIWNIRNKANSNN